MNNCHWISILIKQVLLDCNDFYDKTDKIALDLGCGTPIDLFKIYHNIEGFKKLYAIDINSDKFNETDSYLIYKSIEFQNQLDVHNFKILFDINLSIFGEKFLESNKDKFDLIIISNFLHMYSESKNAIKILSKLIDRLETNGLIYFSVANENHDYSSCRDRITFKEEKIKKIMEPLKELIFIKKEILYQGIYQKKKQTEHGTMYL